jgi:hypothetical protein
MGGVPVEDLMPAIVTIDPQCVATCVKMLTNRPSATRLLVFEIMTSPSTA